MRLGDAIARTFEHLHHMRIVERQTDFSIYDAADWYLENHCSMDQRVEIVRAGFQGSLLVPTVGMRLDDIEDPRTWPVIKVLACITLVIGIIVEYSELMDLLQDQPLLESGE